MRMRPNRERKHRVAVIVPAIGYLPLVIEGMCPKLGHANRRRESVLRKESSFSQLGCQWIERHYRMGRRICGLYG
jgi:hypothetical protein